MRLKFIQIIEYLEVDDVSRSIFKEVIIYNIHSRCSKNQSMFAEINIFFLFEPKVGIHMLLITLEPIQDPKEPHRNKLS